MICYNETIGIAKIIAYAYNVDTFYKGGIFMICKKRVICIFVSILIIVHVSSRFGIPSYASASLTEGQKLDLIKQYAPKVYFHNEEQYFPDNVENWFQATEVHYLIEDTRVWIEDTILLSGSVTSAVVEENVTADNIANQVYEGAQSNQDGKFFLRRIVDSAKYGDNDGVVNAPVYVKFYEGNDYYEMIYLFWYPHNGNIGPDILGIDGASHQGDWERITVILEKENHTFDAAIYNAHGDEHQYYTQSELEFEGSHPVVYSAIDSHASYALEAATSTGSNEWKIDRPAATALLLPDDHISKSGQTWETWHNVQVLENQPWLDYRGRWGNVGIDYKDGPYGPGSGTGSTLNKYNNFIEFYARDNCIGIMRAGLSINGDITYNIQEDPPSGVKKLSNDDIRSLKLIQMDKDTCIRLYDSPSGSTSDDYVEIFVKKDIDHSIRIDNIEAFLSNDYVYILPHLYNGLSGKVSRVEVRVGVSAPSSVARFYEGNNGTQDLVGTVSLSENMTLNLQNHIIENDEIRSMVITDAKAGALLTFYDDPNGGKDDDWAEVYIKGDVASIKVDSFETYVDNDHVRVIPHYVNGLDGKISRVSVNTHYDKLPDGSIMFYEGNNCTQDLLGTWNVVYTRVNLKKNPMENDEVRSLRLKNVAPDTVIRVYDSPEGSWGDDVCTITVKRYVRDYKVNSFERSYEDTYVKVQYHKKNGLDGKVSRVEIN